MCDHYASKILLTAFCAICGEQLGMWCARGVEMQHGPHLPPDKFCSQCGGELVPLDKRQIEWLRGRPLSATEVAL